MAKFIETTGRSEEDAIAAALFQLGLDRDEVSVEVLERAKTGFFGFGSSPARVRVSYGFDEDEVIPKQAPKEEIAAAEPLVQEVMKAEMDALRSGKKTREQVGDAAVAEDAERVNHEIH